MFCTSTIVGYGVAMGYGRAHELYEHILQTRTSTPCFPWSLACSKCVHCRCCDEGLPQIDNPIAYVPVVSDSAMQLCRTCKSATCDAHVLEIASTNMLRDTRWTNVTCVACAGEVVRISQQEYEMTSPMCECQRISVAERWFQQPGDRGHQRTRITHPSGVYYLWYCEACAPCTNFACCGTIAPLDNCEQCHAETVCEACAAATLGKCAKAREAFVLGLRRLERLGAIPLLDPELINETLEN